MAKLNADKRKKNGDLKGQDATQLFHFDLLHQRSKLPKTSANRTLSKEEMLQS
jgi:hypothetical protein